MSEDINVDMLSACRPDPPRCETHLNTAKTLLMNVAYNADRSTRLAVTASGLPRGHPI